MATLRKRGKTWYVDFRYKGKRYIRAVGRDKKTAEIALKEIEVKIAKEEFLGFVERKKITFEDFSKKYEEYISTYKSPISVKRERSKINFLRKFFQKKYLSEITKNDIEEYRSWRLSSVSKSTINREIACLKYMLRLAVDWGYLRENPAKGIKMYKEPPGRLRYLSKYEISKLLSNCDERIYPVVLCALHTGMRYSEIINLKWENIDLLNRCIIIENTKNNERRIIPLTETLYNVLFDLPKISEYVFTYKGKRVRDIRKGFKKTLEKAGIKDFKFHDLRHTFASYLVMSGVDLRTVAQLLGHKTIKMTMRYSHLSPDFLKTSVRKLEESLKEIHKKEVIREDSI